MPGALFCAMGLKGWIWEPYLGLKAFNRWANAHYLPGTCLKNIPGPPTTLAFPI